MRDLHKNKQRARARAHTEMDDQAAGGAKAGGGGCGRGEQRRRPRRASQSQRGPATTHGNIGSRRARGLCRIQRVDAERPALCHVDFRAVLAGCRRVIGDIVVHILMEVQKVRMIQLYRTRMGVDERHHRLQGDE